MNRFEQFLCSLRGHDFMFKTKRKRMYLECASCGYESPGWDLSGRKKSLERVEKPNSIFGLQKELK